MGSFGRRILNHFLTSVFLSLIVIISLAALSSSAHRKASATTENPMRKDAQAPMPSGYRVFHITKTTPFVLHSQKDQEAAHKMRKKVGRKRKKPRHMAEYKSSRQRSPFSVMLPKGFVPPSGSSPCHNEIPDSDTTLYCDLSASRSP